MTIGQAPGSGSQEVKTLEVRKKELKVRIGWMVDNVNNLQKELDKAILDEQDTVKIEEEFEILFQAIKKCELELIDHPSGPFRETIE